MNAIPERARRGNDGVHMVGVGGCAMSGLARLLLAEGWVVTGSDASESATLDELRRIGVPCSSPHDVGNLVRGTALVIRSAAVPQGNVELNRAREFGIPIRTYAEQLGELVASREGLGVAGTHGKTTTGGMLASVLRADGRDPSILLGGLHPELGCNAHPGRSAEFVFEACEYGRSFHHLRPRAAILTNLELDHPDIYPSFDELTSAFEGFVARIVPPGPLVVRGDDDTVSRLRVPAGLDVVRVGLSGDHPWRVEAIRHGPRPRFALLREGRKWAEITLAVPGEHSVANAAMAAVLAAVRGVSASAVERGLGSFPGVLRRFQHRGCFAGIDLIDDYAHHPTEVRCTLAAAREAHPERRVVVLFQPHQLTRLKAFSREFVEALAGADRLLLAPTYSVRERRDRFPRDLLSRVGHGVAERGTEVDLLESLSDAPARLAGTLRDGDVCLVLGAGDVDSVIPPLQRALCVQARGRSDLGAGKCSP